MKPGPVAIGFAALALAMAACGEPTNGLADDVPAVTITGLATTTTTPTTTTEESPPTTAAAAPSAETAAAVEATRDYGTVEISGVVLPPVPSEGSDPGIGQRIPALSGHDFAGAPVSITDDGQAKMIIFLAHWCPHCQRELPIVAEWLASDSLPEGVDVYAVATLTRPERDNYPPDAWFERNAWSGPVIVDDQGNTASGAFGLVAVPYWVIVDATGTVVARGSGGVPPEVLSEIARSLAGITTS